MCSVTSRSEAAVARRQSARGRIMVGFGAKGLRRLRQEGCGRCMMPETHENDPAAVVVNTAGGLTGGDRFTVEARLEAGARLTITTQAAERIYRSASGCVQIENRVALAAGSRLDWLPQETILFNHACLRRHLRVEMEEDACFLGLEILVLGREAMGEDITGAAISDNWRIHRGGHLVHAEALRLEGDVGQLARQAALLDANRAIATLVMIAPAAEALLDDARAALPEDDVRAAVTAWEGRLVARWLARDLMPLKTALRRFLAKAFHVNTPHVWQT